MLAERPNPYRQVTNELILLSFLQALSCFNFGMETATAEGRIEQLEATVALLVEMVCSQEEALAEKGWNPATREWTACD